MHMYLHPLFANDVDFRSAVLRMISQSFIYYGASSYMYIGQVFAIQPLQGNFNSEIIDGDTAAW